jgi:hypothetical protein
MKGTKKNGGDAAKRLKEAHGQACNKGQGQKKK